MTQHRVQKIIAQAGICSRRKAECLIKAGRVEINGKIARLGDQVYPKKDSVFVDGIELKELSPKKVYLINKPIGLISSCKDTHGRATVLELLPKEHRRGIFPIGRLDLNSRGALLLTNHGELALQLTHPRYLHEKKYKVWITGVPSNDSLKEWRNGILLHQRKTMKAKVNLVLIKKQRSLLEISMTEGRNRQIREIAVHLGHQVIDLKRISIAGLTLGNLKEGQWRQLDETEWCSLIKK